MAANDAGISRLADLSISETPLALSNSHLPKSYALALVVDHLKPNFSGSVSIDLAENPASRSDGFCFALHAHKLVVTKAVLHVEGVDIPLKISSSRAEQKVSFSTEATIEAGKQLTVQISYVGTIASIKTYKDDTYGVFKTNYSDSVEGKSDNYVIATHTQPFGARSIFPVVDELTVKVPITLTITTKSNFKVVSNAALRSAKTIDMTENSVFEFKATPPIAPSVFGFVIGHLECLEDTSGKVPVRIFTTKGDGPAALYALKMAAKLLPLFVQVLGVEYPLDKFDIVTLPFLSDWVMENWGMVTVLRDNMLIHETSAPAAAKYQIRQLIAHQLTHQWVGNLITFDEWQYLWLNEAFATWIGDYILSLAGIEKSDTENYDLGKLNQVESLMDIDCFNANPLPSLHEHMSKMSVSLQTRTMSLFEKDSYEKGMILLNMIGTMIRLENNDNDLSSFFKSFQTVLSTYKHKAIKPFEIWNIMNDSTSVDLLSFVHSWERYPGYPCLEVNVVKSRLKIVQQRFLYNDDATSLGLENQPFHVPLGLKVLKDDGGVKYVNLMLTDRSMELDITASQLVSLNVGKQFYYKVVYDPVLQSQICQNISNNIFLGLDIISLINDYGKLLGHESRESSKFYGKNQILMLASICDVLAGPTWKLDYHVLKVALGYLEAINAVMVHFSDYTQFKMWLDKFSLKLYNKIGGWEQIDAQTTYDATEYEVRNVVLQLASESKESQALCKKMYKNFINSGVAQRFVAKELLSSVFNVTMVHATMSEYKQILSLVKNANVSYLKHTNASAQELQTAAVSSLSFTTKSELLSKTLHFVSSNIDSKLIELALIGFKYQHDASCKQALWAWYKVNYDQWVKRSLRKGSDWSKQIGITVNNISRLVLGEVMQLRHGEAEEFVSTKSKTLPPHELQEKWKGMQEENSERRAMARYYDELCALVNSF